MFDNKKAQVGETVTWMVATVAIVIILVISVLVVSIGPFKNREFIESGTSDLLVTKSLAGYLLTEDVWNNLKDKKGIAGETVEKEIVDLFKNIFILYEKEYPHHWIGIVTSDIVFNPVLGVGPGAPPNSQFGFGNRLGKSQGSEKFYYNQIKLNENIILELILIKFTKL
jgi:hypothetical protein